MKSANNKPRKRHMRTMKNRQRYLFHRISLNVFQGEANQRNDVSGRLEQVTNTTSEKHNQKLNIKTKDARFRANMAQIGPKWDKFEDFFQIRFSTFWLISDLKKSRICAIWGQSHPRWA